MTHASLERDVELIDHRSPLSRDLRYCVLPVRFPRTRSSVVAYPIESLGMMSSSPVEEDSSWGICSGSFGQLLAGFY